MPSKLTTFYTDLEKWNSFQKKVVDNSGNNGDRRTKSEVATALITNFMNGKIKVDIFEKELIKESYIAGLHMDEEVWLRFNTFLSKEKMKYIGDKAKQKALNKGNVLNKLITHYTQEVIV